MVQGPDNDLLSIKFTKDGQVQDLRTIISDMADGIGESWVRHPEEPSQPQFTLSKQMCVVDGVIYAVLNVKQSHEENEQENKKGKQESPLATGIMLILVDEVASAI